MYTIEEIAKKINELLDKGNGRLEIKWDDAQIASFSQQIHKAKVRSELASKHGIVTTIDVAANSYTMFRTGSAKVQGVGASNPSEATKNVPQRNRAQHTYVFPPFHDDVVKTLSDEKSYNIWFVGPTGSGKTQYVNHLAAAVGKKKYGTPIKVYQINGRKDFESSGFLGDKTIEIDAATKQNYIKFSDGIAIKAMTHGLDDKGNEANPPAWLFIDEVAALPSYILISLNRMLENSEAAREVTLDGDGGRIVKSHSGFRIICAGNTLGRGLNGIHDSLYTAQGDALDISTLNRFSCTFRFGYNREAEKSILQEKTGDDRIVMQVLKIRDIIRGHIKQGKLRTPFSTRTIVDIADMVRVHGSIAKALYYTVLCKLETDERTVYNEEIRKELGMDILKEFEVGDGKKSQVFDYMD